MIYGREMTEELFLADVHDHKVKVLLDTDTHKHIRFQAPNTNFSWFDLVTWPGHLCVTGDMATYVFMRESDMFEFFRTSSTLADNTKLNIKPAYWASKCTSHDKCDPVKEWASGLFKIKALEGILEYLDTIELPEEEKEIAYIRFKQEVMNCVDDSSKEEVYRNIIEFSVNGQHPFHDWYEVDTDKYSDAFLWCCYAIAWGIKMYDKHKEQEK